MGRTGGRAVAIGLTAVLTLLVGCSDKDDTPSRRGLPERDFVLSITWTDCERLVRQGAGFSVSTGLISAPPSMVMDGGFEKFDCADHPMELGLPRAESYKFDVEGDIQALTYEELEEQDFHVTL